MRGFALILSFLLIFVVGSAAAQVEARASMGTETPVLAVGDAVELLVLVEHPAGYRVITPELPREWGELEVANVAVVAITPNSTLGETTELRIGVTAWAPGSYESPELTLKLAAPDGSVSGLNAGTVALTVESVLNPDDLTLRDIKPQAALPFPSLRWLYYLAGAAAALLVASLFVVLRRRRSTVAPERIGEPEDLRPAHVIALETLSQIEAQNLPSAGQFQEHYTQISDTMRRYLERGFNIQAMEATSFEIRRALRRDTSFDIVQRAQVERVLQEADLVKFAKAQPDAESAKALPQVARDFVTSTQSMIVVDEVEDEGAEVEEVSAETTPEGAA